MPRRKRTQEEAMLVARRKEDERRELAAMMLADSVVMTDVEVAARYGKSTDTVGNYRAQLATDPLLAGMVAARLEERRKAWAGEVPAVLREAMTTIMTIARNIRTDPTWQKNPGALKEVTGAFEVVAKVKLANDVLNARIPRGRGEDGGQTAGDAAGGDGDSAGLVA
jgi:hypothetical protein